MHGAVVSALRVHDEGNGYATALVLALPSFMHMDTYTRDGNYDCLEHRRRRVARLRLALRDGEFVPPRQE